MIFPPLVPKPPYFSLLLVPGSPTLLFANWSAPLPTIGIIIGYIVYCNTSASQAYPEQRIGPNIPTTRSVVNVTILAVKFSTGLKPYTQYSCYVAAITSVGDVSYSMTASARTDEGGTLS